MLDAGRFGSNGAEDLGVFPLDGDLRKKNARKWVNGGSHESGTSSSMSTINRTSNALQDLPENCFMRTAKT